MNTETQRTGAQAPGTQEFETKEPENKKSAAKSVAALGYPGLLLGAAVLLSTSLLAAGHLATKESIKERQAEDLKASLAQVMPTTLYDNDLLESPVEVIDSDGTRIPVYRGERQQAVTGVAYAISAADGYGGTIRMIMGIAPDGHVLGVRVLSHAETPGLGDKIETTKSNWILGFDGYSLQNLPESSWAVKKDGGQFDQFTGATVTPRAVVKAVKQGLKFYRRMQTALLVPSDSAEKDNSVNDSSQKNNPSADKPSTQLPVANGEAR
ncbi:electron transport complex subunit RsxG [Motiliproteus sp. MSK22-1]|uniref:electron transport complex subunit RsxG n=1 Tax=Motiliproteus sp. MSK22-1 TaxID=1897630 RepID=UPI00097889D4|nr:electron transport complex subunit RsxG [Motiliproteus sp. MSK22-1]OMH37951.1 hypothetical protein BGP75_06580 [Motiliproteus sp. MSK22-1]